MRQRVVILSGHSLFAEGVASRLKKHEQQLDLWIVDIAEENFLSRLVSLEPATVILDAMDSDTQARIKLSALLKALPGVSVIQLDPQQSQVQVVTSKEHKLSEVQDLIDLIQK